MKPIKKTLEYLINAIIPESDSVKIEEIQIGETVVFEISAPTESVGRIIGKDGKIIKSIRTIVSLTYPQDRFLIKIKD